jgi:hypothetical protein
LTRTCTSFPWTIENGTLAISSDLNRDEQDIIATVFTRIPERIMRPYTAGTPDFTFSTLTTPDLIAKKLSVAVEEQCPTIASCAGFGSINDEGLAVVRLNWVAKIEPDRVRSLRMRVTG